MRMNGQVVALAKELHVAETSTLSSAAGSLNSGHIVLVRGPTGNMFASENDLAEIEFCVMVSLGQVQVLCMVTRGRTHPETEFAPRQLLFTTDVLF